MTLTPERWRQVREVLHAAMQVDEGDRSAFLHSQCASDPSLRDELNELLAAEGQIGSSFLEKPAIAHADSRTETSDHASVLTPGARLGPYVVQSLIGAGGMGEVYRARDGALKREVAIKVLPSSFSGDHDRLRRFQLEAEAAAALNHPNILSIYHIGHQDGAPYIVTELLEGETLREYLRYGALRLRDAIDIAIQVAKGLAAAHEKGIAHRDLKPENLFLAKDGRVKILDFGLAKLILGATREAPTLSGNNETDAGRVLGTVGYMSPEQVRGRPADARSDIFALGCVLYEMLTGKRAFHKPTAAETMNAILNEDPPAASEITRAIPPALQRVVQRCLEKPSDRRFQSASDLAFALDALSETGSSAPNQSRVRRPGRFPIAMAIVSTLVVLAATIVIYRQLSTRHLLNINVQNMKMTRLTDSGKVGVAAISGDGRYIAYSLREPNHSLWIQQISPESKVRIVPPSPDAIQAVTFSPDESSVYFVRANKGYVIPTLGGTPKILIEDSFAGIGVSPDGTKLAFFHGGDAPKSELIVVNRDGTDEHILASYPFGSDITFNNGATTPAWSPDGKLIAMLASRKTEDVLGLYPVAGGAPTVIPLQYVVSGVKWLPDQSGLLLVTPDSTTGAPQVWIKPLPTGKSQRLTNDLDAYSSPSITQDGAVISAVQVQRSLTIFVAPASKPDQGTAIRTGKLEGGGLLWTRGGTLLSHSWDGEFSSLTPDGKERVALFKDEAFDFALCGDAHLILYRWKADSGTIWLSDLAGRGAKRLTDSTLDLAADCSPDGKSVIFIHRVGSKYQLFKSDTLESTPKRVSKREDIGVYGLRYSPDGQSIADIEVDEKNKHILVIRNAETGEPVKSFAMPEGYFVPWSSAQWILRWTPDGKTLTYALWRGLGSPVNLWRQSVAGGPPRQITNFPDEIVAYDWSPDGKQLAYTRYASIRDVVLISNFR